jgi:hypothetical protein
MIRKFLSGGEAKLQIIPGQKRVKFNLSQQKLDRLKQMQVLFS